MKLVTLQEAARQTGYTDSYLRRMLRDGRIVGQKIGQRCWVLDQKTVSTLTKKPYSTGRPRAKNPQKA